MPLTHTAPSNPIRTRRGLALLAALAIVLSSLLIAVGPALANPTNKDVGFSGNSIKFTTSDSSRNVSGDVLFRVYRSGNWTIAGDAHNANQAWRNVRWTCDLTLDDARVTVDSERMRVPRQATRDLDATAHSPFAQLNFDDLVERGQADCDIVVG